MARLVLCKIVTIPIIISYGFLAEITRELLIPPLTSLPPSAGDSGLEITAFASFFDSDALSHFFFGLSSDLGLESVYSLSTLRFFNIIDFTSSCVISLAVPSMFRIIILFRVVDSVYVFSNHVIKPFSRISVKTASLSEKAVIFALSESLGFSEHNYYSVYQCTPWRFHVCLLGHLPN